MNTQRCLLTLVIAAAAVPLATGCGAAPQTQTTTVVETEKAATPANEESEFLFVQTADSATLADGVLVLGGINPATLYFTDRPDRMAGHLTTEEFVATWGEGADSVTGGACSLFIDIIGRPLTPVSYAGVARRTMRRAVIY